MNFNFDQNRSKKKKWISSLPPGTLLTGLIAIGVLAVLLGGALFSPKKDAKPSSPSVTPSSYSRTTPTPAKSEPPAATPIPTPVYTPSPVSTPAPTPTSTPVSDPRRGPQQDVLDMDPEIARPLESSYLPNYGVEIKYIQSHFGASINVRKDTESKSSAIFDTMPEAARVTVYAYEKTYALVKTGVQMGWVTAEFLVDEYEPYHQSITDGVYSGKLEGANAPGAIYYVATMKITSTGIGISTDDKYRFRVSDSIELYDIDGNRYTSIVRFLTNVNKDSVNVTFEMRGGELVYVCEK